MTGQLEGKVALLTGAAGGKGLALAELFVREGARVILTDIEEEGGQSNAAGIGKGSAFIRLDVTNEDDWKAVVGRVVQEYGRIDVLVNSARIHTRNSDLATMTLDDWREQTAVNLDGTFLGTKHCLPAMRAAGGGAIVNVVSVSAVAPFAPAPAYSASHAAVLNLTHTTAVNCARARENIRVNCVICGMSSNSPVGAIMDVAERLIPLGRPACAEDIANAILWLASEDSRYVTGTSITLDGGYTAEGYPGA
jgi:NAD(P)-dependent dehydrogenase (short-subunit alcohol dehydrogenase family)